MDKFFKIESSKYNEGVFFTEYNGNYQLLAGQTGNDGENYKKWVFPQLKDRLPGPKGIPMGVNIGHKEEATITLKAILAELEGGVAPAQQDPNDDDIPF